MEHRKIWLGISTVTSLVAISLSALLFWMLYYPYKTIDFAGPVQILNKEKMVERGHQVQYVVNYHKYVNARAHVVRQLVDGVGVASDDYYSNLPVGDGTISDDFKVPEYVAPGTYRLRFTIDYEINALRSIEKVVESEPFKVINKK